MVGVTANSPLVEFQVDLGTEDLMLPRDKITAELAKGDPGVIGDLQDVFARTRRATLPAGEQ